MSEFICDKNKEILYLFALELNIPLPPSEKISKAKLCGLISRQLVYGKVFSNKGEKEMEKLKSDLIIAAKKFNIEVSNRSFSEIFEDLQRIIL